MLKLSDELAWVPSKIVWSACVLIYKLFITHKQHGFYRLIS